MAYVSSIEDDHALVFDGPVTHGRTDPRLLTTSSLDDVRDSWEFALLPDKELEMPALRRNALEALKRIESLTGRTHTERRILDFGSGWGFFLAVAKERGWNAHGLEPLPASAAYARATFGLNIVTDTLHEHTFPQNYFDVITSFQVFEHLPFPGRDIRHLSNSLRKDGLVLIEVPNFDTWTMRILKSRHRHFVQDHLNFFSLETLTKLLSETGFRVTDHYRSTRRMSIRHLTTRWLPRCLPASVVDPLQELLRGTRIWDRTIGLNLGDIITVIARKV